MKLQKNPNNWSCLPTSFAMVLDMPVEDFIKFIGHDGSSQPYEDYPNHMAGFHEQECIEIAQTFGYACTPIEMVPQMMPFPNGPIRPVWFFPRDALTSDPEDWNWQRFEYHLKQTCGVLTGQLYDSIGHAVAWDRENIFDPQGRIYPINDTSKHGFKFHTFWKIQAYE